MIRLDSILSRFEDLSNLREKTETGSTRERTSAKKKVAKLLDLEPIIEDILETLDRQRIHRDELGNTENIRPIDDARREEYMARLRHAIPFFAERAFSLPIDYRVPNGKIGTREAYDAFIDAIVIQPEYLSDDFLVSLGLMTEDEERLLSQKEKIEKKISLIPNIKELLRSTVPLRLGERKTTGRIARVANPKSPHFGGYLVFQEMNGIESDSEKKRRNMRRKVFPKFYKDHYSLIRSQRYAKMGLEEKLKVLRKMRDDALPTLLLRWQRPDYSEEEKRQDIAFLEEELKGKTSYHERRAREDRIQKVRFKNPEQDRLRLVGACNDMIRAIEEKLGKTIEISAQAEWLKDSEKHARNAFEFFYEEALARIPELNQSLSGVGLESMLSTENLSRGQVETFRNFIRIVERYHEELGRIPEIGTPFERIRGVIESFLTKIKAHRKERKGFIGKLGIRLVLSLILELKKIRYEVMMKEAEYRIKVRGEGMTVSEKRNLKGKIERVRDTLEHVRFLPEIDLKPQGQEKFEGMIGELTKLIEGLSLESKETGE